VSTASLKHICEGALLAAGGPLTLDQILALFPDEERPSRDAVLSAVAVLRADYEGRACELAEVAGGWRVQIRREFAPWVGRLWNERPQRYSRALLETLALIAYRQPITRGEIEDIRGVAVNAQIVKTLTEREWIRVIGHRDVPGRPELLATTRRFLDYFGLRSLNDLPPLAEIRDPAFLGDDLDLDEPKAPMDDLFAALAAAPARDPQGCGSPQSRQEPAGDDPQGRGSPGARQEAGPGRPGPDPDSGPAPEADHD
jgi:segregation and condensation protein B